MHQQPLIAPNDRPSSSGVSSTGIQVLNQIVVQPAIYNPNASASYGRDDTVYDMMTNTQVNAPFLSGYDHIMAGANEMFHGN